MGVSGVFFFNVRFAVFDSTSTRYRATGSISAPATPLRVALIVFLLNHLLSEHKNSCM